MNCLWCEKEFKATNSLQKYCGLKCRNIMNATKGRKKLKNKAVEYKGGECANCGYKKCLSALTFHHLDPSQKDFGIGGAGETRAWEKVRAELDKCILLCANCHAEEHERLDMI